MDIRIYSDTAGQVPFTRWLETLADHRGRTAIKARLLRVQAGNMGDCKPLCDGVQELRIDHGPGYRVYLSRQGVCWCCCCVEMTRATKVGSMTF